MEKLTIFLNSIDWIFAAIILIGGRYWGGKFFTISKNPAHNFLAFASSFGFIWILIQYLTGVVHKEAVGNLFITFLFTTSFYELLGKKLFEWIENFFPSKNKVQPQPADASEELGGDRPPTPPIKP